MDSSAVRPLQGRLLVHAAGLSFIGRLVIYLMVFGWMNCWESAQDLQCDKEFERHAHQHKTLFE